MVEASSGVEWALLVVVIGVVFVGAFALTARQVGGWLQLQAQLTSPTLPMRYIQLIIPATAGATVFIDPLDTLSGTSWISGVLTFLALFAGRSGRCVRPDRLPAPAMPGTRAKPCIEHVNAAWPGPPQSAPSSW